jgi:hypothetical protein
MPAFRINEPTIRDIGWEGNGKITYSILGLKRWNDLAIVELSISRDYDKNYNSGETKIFWKYDVSNSSYSLEADEGYTYAEGMANYAEALADASAKIKKFITIEDELEKIFQEGEAHREAEAAKKRAEALAKKEADKPVGKKLARKLIETMKAEVKKLGRYDTQHIMAYERGTRREIPIKVEFSRSGMGLFSLNWNRISKDTAIAMLADSHLNSLNVSGCPALPDPNVAAFLLQK